MGLRSDAVYNAVSAVNKSRNSIVNQRPKLTLSDGTEVNRTTFTPNLKGFLILLASYLWTSETPLSLADPKPEIMSPSPKPTCRSMSKLHSAPFLKICSPPENNCSFGKFMPPAQPESASFNSQKEMPRWRMAAQSCSLPDGRNSGGTAFTSARGLSLARCRPGMICLRIP